jgi:hypothetical protein
MKVFSGRNRRTVWNIATSPYSGAHFATWPPKLVEPMILAGTSARGVCPEIVAVRGSGWWRRRPEVKQRQDARQDDTAGTGAKWGQFNVGGMQA